MLTKRTPPQVTKATASFCGSGRFLDCRFLRPTCGKSDRNKSVSSNEVPLVTTAICGVTKMSPPAFPVGGDVEFIANEIYAPINVSYLHNGIYIVKADGSGLSYNTLERFVLNGSHYIIFYGMFYVILFNLNRTFNHIF